jgi:HEAT repeat protein
VVDVVHVEIRGEISLRSRKGPGHAGVRLRERLARWLGVGKAQRFRAGTRAEALTTAYCYKLVAELHDLKILDLGRPFDLETFYVPLQVREYSGQGELARPVRESEVVERKDSVGDLCPSMPPEEALLRFRHLAVLGDPGAGKTTMLRYLALLAAQSRLENLPDFPILVPLGHFAAVPQVNLLDFVISEIKARYSFPGLRPEPVEGLRSDGSTFRQAQGTAGSARWPDEGLRPELGEGLRPYLEERLEKGSVLFLLDGLDEANVGAHSAESFGRVYPEQTRGAQDRLTTKSQEAEATYRHVVGQINILAARYPNCPIVVTARRGSWKGLLVASFHTLEVLGFNRDDIQRFIVNWFGTTDGAQDLQGALFQNPRMWALAANPLLLSLMALAFEQDGELPEGRAGLYRRGVDLLLSTADGENLADTEYKRSLLEEVALHFQLWRGLLLPEDELKGIIAALNKLRSPISRREQKGAVDTPADQACAAPSAPRQGPGQAVFRTGLEEIISQHGLLREQIDGWVGFSHLTWQEYFAAVAISKRGQLEGVLEGLHDPWWEGTTLILAGVLEDATPLLEDILAQEEDIFHSNLLLVGRCLAVCGLETTLRVGEVGLDIVESLKGLLEGGYHRLLQRRAVSVLAEIGGEAVVSFFVALLRREEIDLRVRAEVAQVLGSLRDRSVVLDLLAFLTDEKLDPSVRGNIAETLGSLGDESLIPPLLALLPDETVDPSVRGRIVETLVTLGGANSLSPLLAFLPDEGIAPTVRERISGIVLMARQARQDPSTGLGAGGLPKVDKSAVSQLLSLLSDEKIHPSVRRGVAEALGSSGDESVIPDLLAILSDEQVDPSVRGQAAEALGALSAEFTVPPLLALLSDEKVNYSVRMTVAEVLGVLGACPEPRPGQGRRGSRRDESIASQFLALLSNEEIDPDVRTSIAGALSVLGDKTMVPHLLSLLPDERIDPAVRWRIVDALSSLGDKTITSHLRALLPNEEIDSSVRWMMAEAVEALAGKKGRETMEIEEMEETLGSLDDRSRVPQLLALLRDEELDPSASGRIIEALGSLGDDRATVEGLAALLDREDISSRVYEALFHVGRRAGMRVFARKGGGYEVRPFAYVQEG